MRPFFTFLLLAFFTINAQSQITGIKINGDTCNNFTLAIQATGTSNSSYFFWNFDDPASGTNDTITITGLSSPPFPTHTFSKAGIYNVCVRFKEPGSPEESVCRTIRIGNCDSLREDCKLFVPNTFTPNADGTNDRFYPITACLLEQCEIVIFNRRGGLVFKSSNQSDSWDGKCKGADCYEDVYVYLIAYQFINGQKNTIYGTITLLR